jgi:hypothetical protein
MKPGTVFQVVGTGNHPRIILSDPYKDRFLVCNLTDSQKCPRSPCLCFPSDHEWITKESGIPFEYLTTLPCSGWEPAKQSGAIRISEFPFPQAKLKVICDAILSATGVSENFKQYLRAAK